jgi:hypothetical protein
LRFRAPQQQFSRSGRSSHPNDHVVAGPMTQVCLIHIDPTGVVRQWRRGNEIRRVGRGDIMSKSTSTRSTGKSQFRSKPLRRATTLMPTLLRVCISPPASIKKTAIFFRGSNAVTPANERLSGSTTTSCERCLRRQKCRTIVQPE